MTTTFEDTILVLAGLVAFVLAYSIGSNDVANAIGTAVGSGALSTKNAIIVGGIFEFLGTAIMGRYVSATLRSDIVDPAIFEDLTLFSIGMFSSLFSAGAWLLFATFLALPVSTTQSIVGGIIGFAIVEKGFDSLNSSTIISIAISWITSPILGGLIGFGMFWIIHRFVLIVPNPVQRAKTVIPFISAFTIALLTTFIIKKSSAAFKPEAWVVPVIVLILFIITFITTKLYIIKFDTKRSIPTLLESSQEKDHNEDTDLTHEAEKYFIPLMIISAIFVAFSHGANDVANAVGPYSVVVEFYQTGGINPESTIPLWIIIAGGIGIVIGLATFGQRVMDTIGSKITKLTYSRGYSAQLGAATTVMIASYLQIPVSTTSCLVGAGNNLITPNLERNQIPLFWVTGVGLVRDSTVDNNLDKKLLLKIFLGWIFTLFIGATLSILVYLPTKAIYEGSLN